jgi:hypothetical protein
MRRLLLVCTCLGLLGLAPAVLAQDDKVTLKVVKYDELAKMIGAQKGKVVVIDFWADT